MAIYPNTKTLKKAIPTIRISDQVVKKWDFEVLLTYVRPDKTSWSRAYPGSENVEYLNLTADKFTAEQIISYLNPNIDIIFSAHYDAYNTPPIDQKIDNFDINSLASTSNTSANT